MNSIYKRFLYLIPLMFLFSCEQILDVNPKQSIDASIALESQEGIEAALLSAYNRLQSYKQYGRDNFAVSEALSDNAIHTGNSSHLSNEAVNNRGYHLDNWQNSYYAINELNLILDALAGADYDSNWMQEVQGQAYFLRALFYHNLAKSYAYDPTAIVSEQNRGGVPLMLVGVDDLSKVGSLQRPDILAVYDQMYADLDLAEDMLAQSTVAGPHKATLAAVYALYSRIALYKGDYEIAADKASLALQTTQASFSSNASFLSDWRQAVHPESIFEVVFNESENIGSDQSLRATFTSRATYDAETFTIQAVLAVDPNFYALYEDADVRKGLFRHGVGNNASFYEIYKFISKNGVLNLDNVPVLRISELYLNRAEAYAQTNQDALARTDINTIRTRAGLSPVDTTLSGDALLDEILLQRRLELAFEGHRWFDLKRNGLDVIKSTGNLNFEDYRILAPIPDRETKADNALEQNFDY